MAGMRSLLLCYVASAALSEEAPIDPLLCGVMCGNVSQTGSDWQLCVPGFFQFALKESAGTTLEHAPLNLNKMIAAGEAGAHFKLPGVMERTYDLFYRKVGNSWVFWQRLLPSHLDFSSDDQKPPTPASPTCGPICGDVPHARQEVQAGHTGWEFCQAGMLKGELQPYNVSIGPHTNLSFPFHLQKVLKMQPGTFDQETSVPLGGRGGTMWFRQGLHTNGWIAIFQQRWENTSGVSVGASPVVKETLGLSTESHDKITNVSVSGTPLPDCSTKRCPSKCACAEQKCKTQLQNCMNDYICRGAEDCANACSCNDLICLAVCTSLSPSVTTYALLTCATDACSSAASVVV